jgi:hypothetical protein
LDDRDYYRQELARKSGGLPSQRLDHRTARTTLLDRIIDQQQVPASSLEAVDQPTVPSDANYLARLARRLRGLHRLGRLPILRGLAAICTILAAISAAAPLVMTPRATYAESWKALTAQVVGNIYCTRWTGFVIYVRLRRCDAPTSLPHVQSPAARASR